MKFVISREALLRPLQLVAGVVEKRQTLPVLSNVLLEIEGQQLSLTGTDLEVELVGRVTLDEVGQEGGHAFGRDYVSWDVFSFASPNQKRQETIGISGEGRHQRG